MVTANETRKNLLIVTDAHRLWLITLIDDFTKFSQKKEAEEESDTENEKKMSRHSVLELIYIKRSLRGHS